MASDDEIQIVELNDTEDPKPPLDRPGTTVVHLESVKDINYAKNKIAAGNRNKSNDNMEHKQLSTIPYRLERLHKRRVLFDLLRDTKLRDLFTASYIFRYIVCIIIGCTSFLSLAALWKLVFRINQCRIEGPRRQFKYWPFAFGFMTGYQVVFIFYCIEY